MPSKRRTGSEFGERLVALRKARGLTQVELAEKIGSTQRAISHYENIATFPPAPVVVELAKALGVSTDELLGTKPSKQQPVEPVGEERRLWKKFQQLTQLPEKDRRAVIRLVNSLVEANEARR